MRRLDEQETRLDQLKKEVEKLEAEHSAAKLALEARIQSLTFDVTL